MGDEWDIGRLQIDDFTLGAVDLERVAADLLTDYEHDRSYLDWLDAFDLLRLGYFREAVIIAHTALDAFIVRFLKERLPGPTPLLPDDAETLIDSIKENRLVTYFDVHLRLVTGRSIKEKPDLYRRLRDLNQARNDAVHQGIWMSRSDAKRHVESARLILAFLKELERGLIQKHLDNEVKAYQVLRNGVLLSQGFRIEVTGGFEPIRDYFAAKVLVPDASDVPGVGFSVAGHTRSVSSMLTPAINRLCELGFEVKPLRSE